MSITSVIRKHLSEGLKQRVLRSLPYRLYKRTRLRNNPVCFSVELTTKCNVKCDMCTRFERLKSGHLSVKEMDDGIVSRVIEEIKTLHDNGRKVYLLPMGLGEMIMYSKLFDVFRRIKTISKNIPLSLTTNGTLLDDNNIEQILDADLHDIVISLNTYRADLYHERMGADHYDRVIDNIRRLISARRKRSLSSPAIFIQYLQYSDQELPFIEKEIEYWIRQLNRNDKCFVHPIVNQAGCFGGSSFGESIGRFPCTQPLWRVAIRINGDMYPCDPSFYAGNERLPSLYLGNISNVNPSGFFLDQDSPSRAFVDQMRRDDYSKLPLCAMCNSYKLGCNAFFKMPLLSRSGLIWR